MAIKNHGDGPARPMRGINGAVKPRLELICALTLIFLLSSGYWFGRTMSVDTRVEPTLAAKRFEYYVPHKEHRSSCTLPFPTDYRRAGVRACGALRIDSS